MKHKFKDPLKPKPQSRRNSDGSLVKTLVGGVITLALVRGLTSK